jgi:hypothetical protein
MGSIFFEVIFRKPMFALLVSLPIRSPSARNSWLYAKTLPYVLLSIFQFGFLLSDQNTKDVMAQEKSIEG